MPFIVGRPPFELMLENELVLNLLKRQHIMEWDDIDTFGKEITGDKKLYHCIKYVIIQNIEKKTTLPPHFLKPKNLHEQLAMRREKKRKWTFDPKGQTFRIKGEINTTYQFHGCT
jgi:hypothetical protein